jgi:hypothetical protein
VKGDEGEGENPDAANGLIMHGLCSVSCFFFFFFLVIFVSCKLLEPSLPKWPSAEVLRRRVRALLSYYSRMEESQRERRKGEPLFEGNTRQVRFGLSFFY